MRTRLRAFFRWLAPRTTGLGDSMVLLGFILGAAYWGLESLLNVFSPGEISFYREIFGPNVDEMWMRVIVFCLFLIFGSHVQYTINNRKKAEEQLIASLRKLQYAKAATILGLAKLAEYRDKGTGLHLERIREYARLLAEELAKLPPYRDYITAQYLEDLYHSAILHDIGKVGISDTLLLKPDRLTGEEHRQIQQHTVFGGDTLAAIESQLEGRSFLNLGKQIAYHHHEKWDGSGYPRGLKGEAIPLSARIVALADVYDALTTERFYKDAYSHEAAKRWIVQMRGKAFDPQVVDAFLRCEAAFDRVRREKMREEQALEGPQAPVARREDIADILGEDAGCPQRKAGGGA